MIAECLDNPSGEWMGCHNTSVSLAEPRGMGNGHKQSQCKTSDLSANVASGAIWFCVPAEHVVG